ncbi:response regulator [Dyadobacter psychrotolerans]|uniref:Response regulator n=1 Tax=Dyadobacter psychrotolerans TaxID=2541721 RepID=A0A4R5DCT6_9BACT|nr:response regulator [Dyadobacter psychrotolerans]TDE11549.1 response regulator [Dyadobacter psychrotolerans]
MPTTKTIYLVDDDDDDRMLFREAIESVIDDIRIIEVTDGKELLDMIKKKELSRFPMLILMDMNMPRVSGLEAIAVLKADPYCQDIPVVMISTTSNPELVRQAYEAGINAYMTKPVLIEDYIQMAEAINVCFLNQYPAFKGLAISKTYKATSILFVEDNADHWGLMDVALKESMPNVKISGTTNRQSTLEFLASGWKAREPFPQLILLDLYLPTREEGLNLLDDIKGFFSSNNLSTVPIIVLSNSDHQDDIKASYQHKANAYMIKSTELDKWFPYFQDLCHFWWRTIVLPKSKFQS